MIASDNKIHMNRFTQVANHVDFFIFYFFQIDWKEKIYLKS